jgi:hypothetical protein
MQFGVLSVVMQMSAQVAGVQSVLLTHDSLGEGRAATLWNGVEVEQRANETRRDLPVCAPVVVWSVLGTLVMYDFECMRKRVGVHVLIVEDKKVSEDD